MSRMEITLLILETSRLNTQEIAVLLENLEKQRSNGGILEEEYEVIQKELHQMLRRLQLCGMKYKKRANRA